MAIVADQPIKTRRPRSLQLGANVIFRRPWILFVVVTSSVVAWLFQPERTVSGLAKSFALPPLDVYSDVVVRTRGWGVFIFLLLVRWITFAIVISLLVRRRPSVKQVLVSLGVYVGASLSFAIPLNLGRIYLTSSIDEASSLPALAVITTPFVLVILTRLFTQLLLRSSTTSSSNVGWLVPALSVALWTVGPRLMQSSDITAVSVLLSLLILTVQTMLLASLVRDLQTDS